MAHLKLTPGVQPFSEAALKRAVAVSALSLYLPCISNFELSLARSHAPTQTADVSARRRFGVTLLPTHSPAALPPVLSQVQLEGLAHRQRSPEFHLSERARVLAYGDIPIMRPLSSDHLTQLQTFDLDRLYGAAFTDPDSLQKLHLVLLGDLPEDAELLPLIETYVASLTTTAPAAPAVPAARVTATPSTDLGPSIVKSWDASAPPTMLPVKLTPARETIRQGKTLDGKAVTIMVWRVPLPSSDPEAETALVIKLKAAAAILESRLLEVLRTQKSEIYNINVSFNRSSLSPFGMLNLEFNCEPGRAEALEVQVREEVRRVQSEEGQPREDEVRAAQSMLAEKQTQALNDNSYWLFWLLDSYKSHALSEATQGPLNSPREMWVDAEAAHRSVDLNSTEIQNLDAQSLLAVFREAMPIDSCLSLTLAPEQSNL